MLSDHLPFSLTSTARVGHRGGGPQALLPRVRRGYAQYSSVLLHVSRTSTVCVYQKRRSIQNPHLLLPLSSRWFPSKADNWLDCRDNRRSPLRTGHQVHDRKVHGVCSPHKFDNWRLHLLHSIHLPQIRNHE